MNAIRMPDAHIVQVRLRTANLYRALEFYRGVVGFTSAKQSGKDIALSATDDGPALILLSEEPDATPRPLRATGLYHFAIRHPERRDLAHALQRLLHRNYQIEGASNHDVSEAIYLSDPDGNGIELCADRPRSSWRWHNGQVAMSTRPLDMGDLLATIRSEPSPANLSPRTNIGHIHLHVANLAQAELFFHDFLGFDVTQRSYPGALFFSAGGYHHHVAVNTWAGNAAPPANSVGLLSYRLDIPSQEALALLRERAAKLGYKTRKDVSGADSDLLKVQDPNGNWLEIHFASPSSAERMKRDRASLLSRN